VIIVVVASVLVILGVIMCFLRKDNKERYEKLELHQVDPFSTLEDNK